MANVKTCKACRSPNDIGAVLCNACFAAVFEVESAGSVRVESAGGSHAVARIVLEWPWADIEVVGQLAIGREETFSPIAQYLDPYDNVSRQHAEVVVADGKVTVRDLGSTNGTFVNGKRVNDAAHVFLGNGDELRFAQDLTARIRIIPR